VRRPPSSAAIIDAVASKGTPATHLLGRRKVAFTLHEYHVDPREASYGKGAAASLGVPAARVFKTLVAEVDGRLTVGVVPVTGSLSLKALAAAAGGKRAAMADPTKAERATGYVTGGISPFGQRTRLPVIVDSSALDWPTVYVSAGRRGLEVEVAPADLVAVTGAAIAPIAQPG
jgi:Cys-tRNA(Pro)/Cys-tRNA(Cys) deacylase